ncbi:MAG: hypothetical protein NTY95_01805 [Bacteroidia bacterium]|jgi:hypothetical protein|nr:hypothetical protein [Bacteroidia bacterium]
MKSTHKKPILQLTDLDRDDRSVMMAKARSVAVENNMDWDKIYDQIKDTHEHCILLLELSKHFKIN